MYVGSIPAENRCSPQRRGCCPPGAPAMAQTPRCRRRAGARRGSRSSAPRAASCLRVCPGWCCALSLALTWTSVLTEGPADSLKTSS